MLWRLVSLNIFMLCLWCALALRNTFDTPFKCHNHLFPSLPSERDPIPAKWEPQPWEPLAQSRGTTGSSGKPLYPCWGYTGLRRGEGAPQGGNYPPCRRPTTHKPSQLQLLPELHANTKPKPVPNSFASRPSNSQNSYTYAYIRVRARVHTMTTVGARAREKWCWTSRCTIDPQYLRVMSDRRYV